jgi:hypothetical protein
MYKGRHYFNVVGKYAMYNNDMDLAKSRSVERKFAKKIFAKKKSIVLTTKYHIFLHD